MPSAISALPRVRMPHVIDNNALPALTENVGVSRKTEHFRRWQQFMRYLVTHGYSYVHLCLTKDEHADMMTTVVSLEAFLRARKILFNL